MGLTGILLGLALLIWLAYRGWSVLLLRRRRPDRGALRGRAAAGALDADLHGRRGGLSSRSSSRSFCSARSSAS
jgi:hypothetical protein